MSPNDTRSEATVPMGNAIKNVDLENDVIQLLVTEVVKAGLESPLRDPILEAVEVTIDEGSDTTVENRDEDEPTATKEKSRVTKAIQGGIVFIVMFVILYVTLRRLTSEEPN